MTSGPSPGRGPKVPPPLHLKPLPAPQVCPASAQSSPHSPQLHRQRLQGPDIFENPEVGLEADIQARTFSSLLTALPGGDKAPHPIKLKRPLGPPFPAADAPPCLPVWPTSKQSFPHRPKLRHQHLQIPCMSLPASPRLPSSPPTSSIPPEWSSRSSTPPRSRSPFLPPVSAQLPCRTSPTALVYHRPPRRR